MVRFATEKDLNRVNELRRQVNEVHIMGRPDIFKNEFSKEIEDNLFKMWNDDSKDIIVIERESIISGFACVEYIDKPESTYNLARRFYHIIEFGVDELKRRQGIATEMFDFIRQDAKIKGFDKIELNMWEFNKAALKFYESVGFMTYRRCMEFENI